MAVPYTLVQSTHYLTSLTDLSAQAVAIKAMDSLLDDLQPGMKVSLQEGTLSLCAKTTSPPPPPSPPSPPLTSTPPMTPHPEHHPAPAPSPAPAQQIEEQIELPQQIAQQQNRPRHTYDLRRRQPVRELAQGERNQGLAARSAPSRRRRRRVKAAPLRASAGRAAGPAEALNAVEQENPVVEEENPVPEVTQCASSTADQNVNFPVPNSPVEKERIL